MKTLSALTQPHSRRWVESLREKSEVEVPKTFPDNRLMLHLSCALMIVFSSLCGAEKWESSDDESIKASYEKQFCELTNLYQHKARRIAYMLREEIDVTHFCRFYVKQHNALQWSNLVIVIDKLVKNIHLMREMSHIDHIDIVPVLSKTESWKAETAIRKVWHSNSALTFINLTRSTMIPSLLSYESW